MRACISGYEYAEYEKAGCEKAGYGNARYKKSGCESTSLKNWV